ncbi:MAG: cytochrome c oxidase subunit II [Opitutales bacterium]
MSIFRKTKTHFTRLFALGLTFTALALSGCRFDLPHSTLDPKGPVAQAQLDLFMVTVWVSLFIFVVVGGVLAWAVWRYRFRPGDENKPLPKQGHGNPLIEIGLIVASVLLLVIIAVPTLEAIWYINELPEDAEDYEESLMGSWYTPAANIHEDADLLRLEDPADEEEVLLIKAIGYQWWWNFEYPQLGIKSSNEFVIPVGKVVRVELRAADVIHSFWLPKIAGKVDLMPGRLNWMWIQADEEGHYYGQCAEFCGESHAYMLFRADAVSEEAFADWVAGYRKGQAAPGGFKKDPATETANAQDWLDWALAVREDPDAFTDDPVQRGAMLFAGKAGCISCHAIKGSPYLAVQGPDLTYVAARKTMGAGILDNTVPGPDDVTIDIEAQHENFYNWILNTNADAKFEVAGANGELVNVHAPYILDEATGEYIEAEEDIKPGNLMYWGTGNYGSILARLKHEGNPLTKQEVHDLATYLTTLK